MSSALPSTNPSLDEKDSRTFGLQSERLLTACLGAFFIAFLPVYLVYLPQLWEREYYRFFPFAFAATIYLAFVRAARRPTTEATTFHWTLRVMALAVAQVTLIFGVYRGSPWPCYLASIITLGLILDFWTESNSKRSLLYLLLPVVLTVRPPFNMDMEAVQGLQTLTSKITSDLLFFVNVDHLLAGNIIQTESGKDLLVDEACSGVQSLFTLMFIAAFLGTFQRYTLPRTFLLVLGAVFWALAMNVFRVFLIAIAQTQFELDLATGWKHEAVGYAGILLATFFMLSSDRLILFFVSGIPDDERFHPTINVLVAAWNKCFVAPELNDANILPVEKVAGKEPKFSPVERTTSAPKRRYPALIFSALLGFLLVSGLPAWGLVLSMFNRSPDAVQIAVDLPVDASWLSLNDFPGCSLLKFDTERRENSEFGDHSELWTVATPMGTIRHSFDHTFYGFHDLTMCYRNIGWQMLNAKLRNLSADDNSWPVAVGEFLRPTGERAIVLFSLFEFDGTAIQPVFQQDSLTFLQRRLQGFQESERQCVQVQTLYQSVAPISQTTIEEFLQAHGKVRMQLKDRVVSYNTQITSRKEP
jgi:exosortase